MTEPFDLRHARINAGLTQRALAEQAGVPLVTVQNLENGGSAHPKNLKKVADQFGVQATDLVPLERDAA